MTEVIEDPRDGLVRMGLRQRLDRPAPIRVCCGKEDFDVSDTARRQGRAWCPDCKDMTDLKEPA